MPDLSWRIQLLEQIDGCPKIASTHQNEFISHPENLARIIEACLDVNIKCPEIYEEPKESSLPYD